MKNPRTRHPLAIVALSLLAIFQLSGCDIFDSGDPETARVVVSGAEGESFQLITTSDFDVLRSEDGEDSDVYIYSADTSGVTAPVSNRYSLGSGIRFYLKAFSEEALSEPITVKVYVDDDIRYNSTSTLGDLELEFVYTFR